MASIVLRHCGVERSNEPIEKIGVERSQALIEAADVLLWLGEPAQAPAHPKLALIHAKSDLAGREAAPEGSLAVSSLTGVGLGALLKGVAELARSLLPGVDAMALNRRQAGHIEEAHAALCRICGGSLDIVTVAEELRLARGAFDRLTVLEGNG